MRKAKHIGVIGTPCMKSNISFFLEYEERIAHLRCVIDCKKFPDSLNLIVDMARNKAYESPAHNRHTILRELERVYDDICANGFDPSKYEEG
jgi:hypothetical protein